MSRKNLIKVRIILTSFMFVTDFAGLIMLVPIICAKNHHNFVINITAAISISLCSFFKVKMLQTEFPEEGKLNKSTSASLKIMSRAFV